MSLWAGTSSITLTPAQQAAQLAASSAKARDADIAKGQTLASQYYDTPQMADILAQYKAQANGLSDPEYNTLRNRVDTEINNSLQTGLRQLRSTQAASGIRGGAAGAQSLSLLGNINNQRTKLASDLAAQDIALKRQGLNDYAGAVGGDTAAKLGTAYGYAGLGATDRSNAWQSVLGQDYIRALNGQLVNAQNTSVPSAFGGITGALGNPTPGDIVLPTSKLVQSGANKIGLPSWASKAAGVAADPISAGLSAASTYF